MTQPQWAIRDRGEARGGTAPPAVLAVFAHPDDAELACFGTLALFAARGYRVEIVTMTNGSGSVSPYCGQRPMEAKEAAALIGAEVNVEDFPDGAVGADRDTFARIDEHLARIRPRVVVTHFVTALDHQDHEATGRAATLLAQRCPTVRLVLQAEPPATVTGFQPTVYVDVTAQLPVKLDAVGRYRSERGKPFTQPEAVRRRGAWWAWQATGRQDTAGQACYEPFVLAKARLAGGVPPC